MRVRTLELVCLAVVLLLAGTPGEVLAASVTSGQVTCDVTTKGKGKIAERIVVLPIASGQRVFVYLNLGNAFVSKPVKYKGSIFFNCANGSFFESKINGKLKRNGFGAAVLETGLDIATCGDQVAVSADVTTRGKKNGLFCGEASCSVNIGAGVRETGVCLPFDPTGEKGYCSSGAQCCSGLCLPRLGDACAEGEFCTPVCQPAADL